MTKILADIGGTYVRFAMSGDIGAVQRYRAADFSSLEEALALYAGETGTGKAPVMIATAAYPDEGGRWRFVNQNKWVIDPAALVAEGWPVELILNDFEAAVWGLRNLAEEDRTILKAGQPRDDLPKCLIGPGTGLGLGYLVNGRAQKTHGGHMIAAGVTDEHWAVMRAVQKAKGGKAVVFENLVSGPGLMNIYRALCDAPSAATPEELLEQPDTAFVREALRLFHEFFGLFAQTVVVSGHAYGGLYLTGGVLDRLVERGLFDLDRFEQFFVLQGVESVTLDLGRTPIIHIKNPYLALQGLLTAQAQGM